MSCSGGSVYIGSQQTLSYGQGLDLITIVLSARNFAAGEGEGLLRVLGYDRIPQIDQARITRLSTLGVPYWQGPSFEAPQRFAWRLQGLSDQQFFGLQAIFERQQRDRGRVRLIDQRWALHEPLPRTRAKIGAVLAAQPGMVSYWAQFWIELLPPSDREYRRDGGHSVSLEARELDRIALSQDA